jgi:hypothetical protein
MRVNNIGIPLTSYFNKKKNYNILYLGDLKLYNSIVDGLTYVYVRGDQEGLFKLVTLDRILNRITGVTSGCWWLVVVNAVPISDICQINQQNISSCSVINNRIKKFS